MPVTAILITPGPFIVLIARVGAAHQRTVLEHWSRVWEVDDLDRRLDKASNHVANFIATMPSAGTWRAGSFSGATFSCCTVGMQGNHAE